MDWMGFGGALRSHVFESQYNCSSTAMAGRDVDEGDKIFLPPSALDRLARMNVEYPMLFEVSNNIIGKKTHCGVLEFSADEGWCYMPFWMMQNLAIEEGSLIAVKNVSLSKATFVKFRPQSVDFIEVSNPRALLEFALRKFTCLTVGDTICIPHVNGRKFYLDVMEVQPNSAASIIETDCNVDFDEPIGYKDSKYAQYEKERNVSKDSTGSGKIETVRSLQKAKIDADQSEDSSKKFNPFSGSAKRIDGKQAKQDTSTEIISSTDSNKGNATTSAVPAVAGIAYQSKIGDKYSKKKTAVSAFTGTAHKLNP
eukprot:gene5696-7862_t